MSHVHFVKCNISGRLKRMIKHQFSCAVCGQDLDGIEYTDNHDLYRVNVNLEGGPNGLHHDNAEIAEAKKKIESRPLHYKVPWFTLSHDDEVSLKTACDSLVTKVFGKTPRYPYTFCYDQLRQYKTNASRADIAQLDLDKETIAVVAVYNLFVNEPLKIIQTLNFEEFKVLQTAIEKAEHYIAEFKSSPINWADYETN